MPSPATAGAPAPSLPRPRRRAAPLALLGLVAGAVAVAGALGYRSAERRYRSERGRELGELASSRAEQVVRWREERLNDARALSHDPEVASVLLGGGAGAAVPGVRELAAWFEGLRTIGDYTALALVDRAGRVRASIGPLGEAALEVGELHALFERSEAEGRPLMSELHPGGPGPPQVDVLAALPGGGARALGLLLRVDPGAYLFRIMASGASRSDGAEVLVVRDDEGGARVLSPSRRAPASSSSARFPPGGPISAAVARGETAWFRGLDYRGVAVVGALAPVPGSPWSVVAVEADRDTLAPLRSRAAGIASVVASLIVAAGAVVVYGARVQRERLERARAVGEAERSALERRLARLTRRAHDMVILADDGQRIVDVNDLAVELLGYPRAELIGMSVRDLRDPATLADYDDRLRQEVDQGAAMFETRYRRKDGSTFPALVSVHAEVHGGRRHFEAIARDISEKKRLEAQLLLADRMASVGTLAAGVAHEINNPLSFVLSNLDFALDELRRARADPEVLRALGDAKDGGARVREIVRDLKTFSRPLDDVRRPIDVRRVLQSAIGLASNEIRHRAQLVVDPGDVPPVAASEHRLGQVLLNLLVNAAQAIPEGNPAANVVRATTSTAPDGRAVVEISDTGVGIPPEVLPRIFDPFFTTKPVGVGTGLGLSICHGLVTQLGGEVSVESAPGRGSTFRVALPPATAAARDEPPPAAAAPGRRGRILVVDDEPLVGRAVSRILSPPHDVVVRTSARAALDDLLGGPPYDVVLCDLMMPEMTGMELHARLAEAAPELASRTIFLTGGAFTASAAEFLERVPNPRLEKPFEPQALRDLVARALSTGAAPAAPGAARA